MFTSSHYILYIYIIYIYYKYRILLYIICYKYRKLLFANYISIILETKRSCSKEMTLELKYIYPNVLGVLKMSKTELSNLPLQTILCVCVRVSLCSPGWSQTHDPPSSASWCQGYRCGPPHLLNPVFCSTFLNFS
jgi:hypothetical protein